MSILLCLPKFLVFDMSGKLSCCVDTYIFVAPVVAFVALNISEYLQFRTKI